VDLVYLNRRPLPSMAAERGKLFADFLASFDCAGAPDYSFRLCKIRECAIGFDAKACDLEEPLFVLAYSLLASGPLLAAT
jgi:hypothetical protein